MGEGDPRDISCPKYSNNIQHVFSLKDNMEPSEVKENKVIIRRIDHNLLNSKRLANHSFLEGKIHQFWDSIDAFLQQGFGYIGEHDNHVVSICFSAFVADQTHAIDIETLEGYTRKHYGTAVARAFIEECKLKRIRPYWDCSPDNTGSIRLAESMGMDSYFDYRIFWYKFS